ncbi:MAG TPA: hypothetical protein VH186_14160 [Chloroflexia bacterium]|nr:hypothetical protein [Chloroflexia bacterium]
MTREAWRKLPFNYSDAGRQLALSESLLAQLEQPSLYWYEANRPALILGAAQKPEIMDRAACRREGFEIYKRTSGGAAVLVGPNFLSLDVALPPASLLANNDVTLAYRWFGECWIDTIKRLGGEARLVTPEEAREARLALDGASSETKLVKLVCFGTLSSYEVVTLDGRKLVGLAQIKRRSGQLLQAGLHFEWPYRQFGQLLALTANNREALAANLQERGAGLVEVLGRRPSNQEIMEALETSLVARWPVEVVEGDWRPEELAQAGQLAEEKFTDLAAKPESERTG